MVKTVSKQCQTVPYPIPTTRPLQLATELHQKDLRIIPNLVYIWGPVWEGVLEGGHLSGLKSNRRLFVVPRVEKAPTCRNSSQTAVSKSRLISVYGILTVLWNIDRFMEY